MKKTNWILLLSAVCMTSGCVGYDIPQPFQAKPYTYIKGGDQLGRDTLENRVLVARRVFPLKGRESNEVLTILGQPQRIDVVERNTSEDWYFIYDKNHVAYAPSFTKKILEEKPGTFLVRLYHDKVIDVVNLD